MNMIPTSIPLGSLSLLSLATVASAAVTFDFETAGQFSDNFTTAQTPLIVQSATGGLNNGGAIDLSGLASSAYNFYTLNHSFSGNLSSWTMSVYYFGDANLVHQIGVTSDPAPGESSGYMTIDAGSSFLPFIYTASGNANGGSTGIIQYHSGLGSTAEYVVDTSTDLPASDAWYHYELSVSYLGGSDYEVTATMSEASSDGSLVGTLGTITQTLSNPDLAADDSVYLYFGLYDGMALDNFSTTAVTLVPEPAMIAFVFGLLSLLGLTVRRRR